MGYRQSIAFRDVVYEASRAETEVGFGSPSLQDRCTQPSQPTRRTSDRVSVRIKNLQKDSRVTL